MVLQIPLITQDQVVYRVNSVGAVETASQDLIYEADEVRILNAWDEHQVENRGDQDRITLYIEAPLTDELFLGHVKRALEL